MTSLHTLRAPADDTGASGGSGTLAEAKQSIQHTAAQLKAGARDTAQRAKDAAQHFAADKKTATAERLGNYGQAMHASADSLEEKDPNIAWFTHRAADRLQGAADYVRNRDFAELRADAEDFAQRHPFVFFGGALAVGLIAGNLIKASGRNAPASDDDFDAADDDATDDSASQTASGL